MATIARVAGEAYWNERDANPIVLANPVFIGNTRTPPGMGASIGTADMPKPF